MSAYRTFAVPLLGPVDVRMSRYKHQPKGPDWPPEQTLRVLKQQLERLQGRRNRSYREAENEETVWTQLTQAALTHGFGEDSDNVGHFHSARWAGQHYMGGMHEGLLQSNYNDRIEKFDANLRSSIAELEMSLPEAVVRGAYDAGDEYAFYRDLKDMIVGAKTEIFIVDNYLNTEFFDLYAAAVRPGIRFRIMTDQVRGNLEAVAKKYAASYGLELRSSQEVHDRHIFIDNRCWTVGQSIKDAARKKPTYMVEMSDGLVSMLRPIYEGIWVKAAVIV
jgi:hypothetical protein